MPAKHRAPKRKPQSSALVSASASASTVARLQEAAKALAISTERYRLLGTDSFTIVWTADADGAILSALTTWGDFQDIGELEMLGHRWLEQVHPDDRPGAQTRWLDALATQAHYESEYRVRHGAAEWRHLLVRGAPLLDEHGDLEGWVGLCEDITVRKRAEQLLALEHLVSRCLAETDDDIHALNSIIRAICEAQEWVFGSYWQVDAATGDRRVASYWCPADTAIEPYFDAARAALAASGSGGGNLFARDAGIAGACVFPLEFEGRTLGLLAFASRAMREPDAGLLTTIALLGDQIGQFLQRKRRDDELLRFRAAMDISADSIWLIDRNSMRFIDVNTTACERFGYTREELLTMGPADLSPNQGENFEHDYDHIIAGNSAPGTSERLLRRKDGSLVLVEARRCAVQTGGRWIIVGISRDLSERLAAQKALHESEEGFRSLAESMPQIVWVCGADGACTYMNRRWVEDTGESIEDSVGQGWLQVLHPDDRQLCLDGWFQSMATGAPYDAQFRVRQRDGSYRWVLSRGVAMRDAEGQVLKWFGTWTDIDDQKQAERTIRHHAMQQNLIAAFGQKALANVELDELLSEAVAVASEGLDVDFCTLAKLGLDGRSFTLKAGIGWRDGWIGRRIADTDAELHKLNLRADRQPVIVVNSQLEPALMRSELLQSHGIRSGVEVPIDGLDGVYGTLGAYAREVRHFTPTDVSFLLSLANTLATATARKDAEQHLTYLAQFDALTALPNRRLFLDRVAQTLTQAQRNHGLVGIMFVDLDRFKAVNDTLGHGLGDRLLVEVAKRLLACTRSGDTVARLGGDEFALMLSSLAKADDALLVAQKVVDVLSSAFDLEGQEAYVSASLGIAIFPDDGLTADILLKNADTAMYRAKERGRNTYQCYLPQMNERALARLGMERQLRGALARNEFLLHYQPKVNLQNGEISGFEALLRWQHPQRGLVPTMEFISILEDTGLIVPIGEWVIREVCEQLVRWPREGVTPRPVAINLSARQFQAKNLDAIIATIMRDSGAGPGLVEFELTESILMSDSDTAILTLEAMQAAGIKVSIDDFGTGYSGLAYLKRFALDALKIDRSFIRDLSTDPDDAMIVLAIINLAHSLKLKVVAEGVETAAQLDFLRAHGCDEMQGYYFAPPLPIADCTRMLREDRRLSDCTRDMDG